MSTTENTEITENGPLEKPPEPQFPKKDCPGPLRAEPTLGASSVFSVFQKLFRRYVTRRIDCSGTMEFSYRAPQDGLGDAWTPA